MRRNTPEEDAAINRGIAADPDAAALSTQEMKALRPFPDVIAAFRATGEGWQTRMNNALRIYLSGHPLKVA
ncbi:MAG: Uncharacterized protein conserved in bacteria [uncultured Caballeronia sp.]|nr:MAG: Uncharacterized protein conserved in bacteria [uncultured Caballeronia sp.]